MNKIIEVLEDNNVNSNETLALDKIKDITIGYNDTDIIIDNNNILLSVIIAKLLSDNVKHLSNDFFVMLSGGYTNSKKQKRCEKGLSAKKVITESVIKLDSITSSAYELSAYAHIDAFQTELTLLCEKYGYNIMLVASDIDYFSEFHRATYLKLKADETVAPEIISQLESVGIDCTMLTKRTPYILLQLDITPRQVASIVDKLTSINMMLVTMPYLNSDYFCFLIDGAL